MPPDAHAPYIAADASHILPAWAVQQVAGAQTEPAVQLGAAVALREVASAGREPIAGIATAGGIPALAALLSSDSAAAASKAAALVALRRMASQPALLSEVAGAISAPACLQLLQGDNAAACAAAAAALLTSLAASSKQHRREAVMQGAPLLLQHVMNGSMQDGVWQPAVPTPDSLEFAAARALHTLHPGAPDTGLWHAGLWQTVSLLDSSGAAEVQQRAVQAVKQLADQRFLSDPMCFKSPEQRALLRRQLAELDIARSVRLLLLVRAGAIPRLLSLLPAEPDPISTALSTVTHCSHCWCQY
ncbi:hypothetical protein COHA_009336 [Chlorella ohadii]|uniref:Uncharacterized protein n=1 Tax=Chlorella ohadii TaxID=2649997 RepID=A0AAD5DJR6_9CHLO|nr:hypothetical protein COHA_009336 [Chlorella ohadii]